jgi:hypothetical protein
MPLSGIFEHPHSRKRSSGMITSRKDTIILGITLIGVMIACLGLEIREGTSLGWILFFTGVSCSVAGMMYQAIRIYQKKYRRP